MGLNMAICELEAENALCRKMKVETIRVLVKPVDGFEDYSGYDMVVSLQNAKDAVDDWEGFMKRNRLSSDVDSIYMEKVKNKDDLKALEPLAEKHYTGWVELSEVPAADAERALEASLPENRITAWHMLSFDEMNETCARCGLSWDKGRGCIGTFGPSNSLLPDIASRHGCEIVGSVLELCEKAERLSPDQAKDLIDEVAKLRLILPAEGKMMVRRYSGVLDRMEAMAEASVQEGCGFYFF